VLTAVTSRTNNSWWNK